MTLQLALVTPEREVWSGSASRVIAKTLDGNIGILTGHAPVFGVLATGSLVRILDSEGNDVTAAVSTGFLSVADDRVSVLAQQALMASDVDVKVTESELSSLLERPGPPGTEQQVGVAYARALLRAAGQSG